MDEHHRGFLARNRAYLIGIGLVFLIILVWLVAKPISQGGLSGAVTSVLGGAGIPGQCLSSGSGATSQLYYYYWSGRFSHQPDHYHHC